MIGRKLSPSLQLSLVFLLFGIVWILLTDALLISYSANNSSSLLLRIQTYKGILFVMLTATLIFFAGHRIFNRQQILQKNLNEQELHYKTQLAQEVFNAQEAERKKLGEELHDNINQLLGVVKLYIEHAQVNPDAKDEMLRKSAQYVMQVINEIRSLSRSLISPTLSDIGLVESINEMIESILEIKEIGIEVKKEGFSEDMLSEAKKTMVYRIMQEQLNNVLKHSQARHVGIQLMNSGSQVHLTIADDGIGFDTELVKPGLGLNNIRNRLGLFNGRMSVESAPGKGCKLEAVFEA